MSPNNSPTEEVGRTPWSARVPLDPPRTIIEKVWDNHIVAEQSAAPTLLYIDLHLVHEVTSPQAFDGLRARGIKVRRPDLTIDRKSTRLNSSHLGISYAVFC